jgi:hypothetical protein
MQLQEVSIFRAWVSVFLRPCGMNFRFTLSVAAHEAASNMARIIRIAADQWDDQEGHSQWIQTPWCLLPTQIQRDVMTPGSPGWVRCQSVHLYRFVAEQSGMAVKQYQLDCSCPITQTQVVCPFVDMKMVVEQFNRFRRQSRNVLNRTIVNAHNTAPNGLTQTANDTAETTGTAPPQTTPQPTRGNTYVGLSVRMKLDTGLVRNIMQEVVGSEPFGDYYLGRSLLAHDSVGVENGQPSSLLVDEALSHVCQMWYRRYHAPLAYSSLLSRDAIHDAMRMLALQPIQNSLSENPGARVGAISAEEQVADEPVMYYPLKHQVPGEDALMLTGESKIGPPDDRSGVLRSPHTLPQRRCLLFPFARIPPSCIVFKSDDRNQSPMYSTSPTDMNSADSLLMTEAFWHATELQKEADESRLLQFDGGFSGIGDYKALRDYGHKSRETTASKDRALSFYLGSETRQTI